MFQYLEKEQLQQQQKRQDIPNTANDQQLDNTKQIINKLTQAKTWITDELNDFYATGLIYYYNDIIRSDLVNIETGFGLFDTCLLFELYIKENFNQYDNLPIVHNISTHILNKTHNHSYQLQNSNLETYLNLLQFSTTPICPFSFPRNSIHKQLSHIVNLLVCLQLMNIQFVAQNTSKPDFRLVTFENYYKCDVDPQNGKIIKKYISFPQLSRTNQLIDNVNNQIQINQFQYFEKDDILMHNQNCNIKNIIIQKNKQITHEGIRTQTINLIIKIQKQTFKQSEKQDDDAKPENYIIPRLLVKLFQHKIKKQIDTDAE